MSIGTFCHFPFHFIQVEHRINTMFQDYYYHWFVNSFRLIVLSCSSPCHTLHCVLGRQTALSKTDQVLGSTRGCGQDWSPKAVQEVRRHNELVVCVVSVLVFFRRGCGMQGLKHSGCKSPVTECEQLRQRREAGHQPRRGSLSGQSRLALILGQ